MGDSLFAGIAVSEFETAREWYERLFGGPPAFFPHETEAVWELGDERFVYVVEDPPRAGHSLLTLFCEELDARIATVASRGLEPASTETYENGTSKVIFRDRDGNEIGFAGTLV